MAFPLFLLYAAWCGLQAACTNRQLEDLVRKYRISAYGPQAILLSASLFSAWNPQAGVWRKCRYLYSTFLMDASCDPLPFLLTCNMPHGCLLPSSTLPHSFLLFSFSFPRVYQFWSASFFSIESSHFLFIFLKMKQITPKNVYSRVDVSFSRK